MVFVTHISDKWLLLHQYLPKNNSFRCSFDIEYFYGLDIIFRASPRHVTWSLLAVTHKNILNYNIMVFMMHVGDKWLLLHQYLAKNNIICCSAVDE